MRDITIQEIILELIKRSSFNEFDGERVVKDLKSNRKLWNGVIMEREAYGDPINLIKLRDISDNYHNVDTLFILPKKGKEAALYKIAKKWKADEIDWIGGDMACRLLGSSEMKGNPKAILRLWFD